MAMDPKPGDRFEIAVIGTTDRLMLPAVLAPDGFAIEQIEDAEGRPVDSVLAPAENSLIVPKLASIVSSSDGTPPCG